MFNIPRKDRSLSPKWQWLADTATWNELSTYPSASSLSFFATGQKARADKIARDASLPELGCLYFTRRKFLAGQARGTLKLGTFMYIRNDRHAHSPVVKRDDVYTLLGTVLRFNF